MSELGDMAKKGESLAEEHPQEADKGIQEAGDAANRETGGKYQSEVQDATGAAERRIGHDSGPGQGGQNQGSQNQGSQNQGSQNQGSQNQGSQDQGGQGQGGQ